MIDALTGEIHYVLRVWYEATYQRMKYTYERVGLDDAEGKWKLKKGEWLEPDNKYSTL